MTVAERRRLTAVARGAAPADLYVAGGTLLNVYTGELYRANVATAADRIAYVGVRDDMIGPRTRVVDATDRVIVPGYIDPHAHPAHLVTPSTLARHVVPLGTTAIFCDTLQFWELGGLRAFRGAAGALMSAPLRFYWMLRVHGQSRTVDEPRRFRVRALVRALAHPRAVAVGEVTRWPDVHAGDTALLRRLDLALRRRLRVEGHTAGASAEKIPAIAAGGLTSDHEPITAEEVLTRARQGIAVMLRESSLRPDLGGLLDALEQAPALVSRLMLTADGSMPAFLRRHGFVDHLIRVALERGVPPIDAYRMATLNPATYFGLDGDLGGVAPGRLADICLVRDLTEPRPATVIAGGRVAAVDGRLAIRVPEPSWRRIFVGPRARLATRWRCRPEDLVAPARERSPVIRFVSAVITRLEERPRQPGDLHAALLDREGRWVAPGVVAGFARELDGLATTTTTDFNILALGRDPSAIARAVNRVLALHGGIVVVDAERGGVSPAQRPEIDGPRTGRKPEASGHDGVVFELALPVGGIMSTATLDEVADKEEEFRALLEARGYEWHDPLFSLFFLAADFLPAVRLTPLGVWDVKRGRVLLPSRRRS